MSKTKEQIQSELDVLHSLKAGTSNPELYAQIAVLNSALTMLNDSDVITEKYLYDRCANLSSSMQAAVLMACDWVLDRDGPITPSDYWSMASKLGVTRFGGVING